MLQLSGSADVVQVPEVVLSPLKASLLKCSCVKLKMKRVAVIVSGPTLMHRVIHLWLRREMINGPGLVKRFFLSRDHSKYFNTT